MILSKKMELLESRRNKGQSRKRSSYEEAAFPGDTQFKNERVFPLRFVTKHQTLKHELLDFAENKTAVPFRQENQFARFETQSEGYSSVIRTNLLVTSVTIRVKSAITR